MAVMEEGKGEALLALFTLLCGGLVAAAVIAPGLYRSSRSLSKTLVDRILIASFGIMLFVAWYFEPVVVWLCGWEGLRTASCKATLIGQLWLYYAETFDPIFLALPVWLRIMCSLDTFLFGPLYLLCLCALLRSQVEKRWFLLLALPGAGALIYSTLVYFAYEVIEESHRAQLLWVFVVNLPWTLAPFLLIARCGVALSEANEGAPAPLLEDCGAATVSAGMSIHDVPTEGLQGQRELALVLIVDQTARRLLFGVENKLRWRCHYGIEIPPKLLTDLDSREAHHYIQADLQQVAGLRATHVRRVGTMLFTFEEPNVAGAQYHLPMRVHVYEAQASAADAQQIRGGTWYDYTKVPYDRMWCDDIVWLPMLLGSERSGKVRFEGHFAFDSSGPGPTAQLLNHNCRLIS